MNRPRIRTHHIVISLTTSAQYNHINLLPIGTHHTVIALAISSRYSLYILL